MHRDARKFGYFQPAIRDQATLTFRYIGGSRPGDIRTVRPKEQFHIHL